MAKTTGEKQKIVTQGKAYFHIMLNMADDELGVYTYRLLGHYVRVGECWEGTRTTAKKTGMSPAMVVQTRKELADLGYIRLEYPENQEDTIRVIVLDRMAENVRRYAEGVYVVNGGVHQVNGGVYVVNERRTNEEEPPKNTNTSAPSAGAGAQQKTPESTPPQKPNPYSALINAIGAAVFGKSTQAGINAVAGRIAVAVHGKKKGKPEDRYIGILEYERQRTGQKADPDALAIEVPVFWKWFTEAHPGIEEMLAGQKIVGRWAEWREKGSPKNKYEAAQKALAAKPPAPSPEGEKPKQEWPGDRLKREKAEREAAAAQKAGEK